MNERRKSGNWKLPPSVAFWLDYDGAVLWRGLERAPSVGWCNCGFLCLGGTIVNQADASCAVFASAKLTQPTLQQTPFSRVPGHRERLAERRARLVP